MLNIPEIFNSNLYADLLVHQHEADYQAAVKEGYQIMLGVGYSTGDIKYSTTLYLTKDQTIIKKKYDSSWQYPRTPHHYAKVQSSHLNWVNFSDLRAAVIQLGISTEESLKEILDRTFPTI
ncbi:TPA: hypothetical protein MW242_002889 [Acinetobacter baumannii]|nr:hypothetical protein [Acinetobacter baumannii]